MGMRELREGRGGREEGRDRKLELQEEGVMGGQGRRKKVVKKDGIRT